MCKTEITPRNETLDLISAVYLIVMILFALKLIRSHKASERVLFFTVTKDGDIEDAEEVNLDGPAHTEQR